MALIGLATGLSSLDPAVAVSREPLALTGSQHDKHHILVRFRAGTAASERAAAHREDRGSPVNVLRPQRVEVVRLGRHDTVEAALVRYRRNANVEFAEPNQVVSGASIPNDSYYTGNGSLVGHDLWGLQNDGQNGGLPDADVDAPEGWNSSLGLSGSPWPIDDFAVGVIDSGISAGHEDLSGKSVRPCYSALAGTGTLTEGCTDDQGHGTHVSGTLAATGGNGKGVVGVAPNARLYMCKALNAFNKGYVADIVACINEIVAKRDAHKIRVLSMSLSHTGASLTEEAAVNHAWNSGVMVVASAGNLGDTATNYPAGYRNAVSVAATDRSDGHASFSSANSDVELSAPGVGVLSTVLSGGYGTGDGTSMAVPHASAAAALVSWKTGKHGQELRDAVVAGVDDLGPAGRDPEFGFGRVNLCKMLDGCVALGHPTSLRATEGDGRVRLEWQGSADPAIAGYRIYRRTGEGEWTLIATTSSSTFTDTEVTIGSTYTYRVSAYDSRVPTNESAASSPATARPTFKTYRPGAYRILSGAIVEDRGSVKRLHGKDDVRLDLSAAVNPAGNYLSDFYAYASITSGERVALNKLSVAYDGHATSGYAALSLYIYNFGEGRWKRVDGPRTGVLSDRSFGWSTLSPRAYVSSSGTLRFRVRGFLEARFRTRTDLARFRLEG